MAKNYSITGRVGAGITKFLLKLGNRVLMELMARSLRSINVQFLPLSLLMASRLLLAAINPRDVFITMVSGSRQWISVPAL